MTSPDVETDTDPEAETPTDTEADTGPAPSGGAEPVPEPEPEPEPEAGNGDGDATPGPDGPDDAAATEAPAGRDRRFSVGTVLGLVAVAVFVVGTVGPPLFGRGVTLAHDLIYFSYPWKATQDTVELNMFDHGPVSDTVDAAYPAKATFGSHVHEGEYLTWNPWVGGGIPLAPTTSGVNSPYAWLFAILPTWYAPAAQKFAQLAVAVGFTYLFCRRLRLDKGPAVFAGIAFAGSGAMVTWTNWEQTDVIATMPVLFWASERIIQKRTLTSGIPLALAMATMMLGFFPAMAFYALYALVPYVLVRLWFLHGANLGQRVVRALTVGGGILAGLGVAAFALVPFTIRLIDSGAADRVQSPRNNLGWANVITTVAPKSLGLSTEGAGLAFYGAGNQVESISFLGVTTVLLALAAVALPWTRRVPRGVGAVMAAITVVLGAATYGGGPLLQFLQKFPAFNNSNIARTRSILGLTVAVLAAMGAQALIERQLPRRWLGWLWATAVAVCAGAFGAYVFRQAYLRDPPPPRVSDMSGAVVLPAIVAVVAVGCALAAYLGAKRWQVLPGAAVAAFVGLLLVESLAFAAPLIPNESRATLYPPTAGIRFLQEHGDDQRFAAEGRSFFGNSPALFELRSTGAHAFFQPTWKEAMLEIDPQAFALSRSFLALHETPEVVGSTLLDRLGTKWWAAQPDHAPIGDREPVSLLSSPTNPSGTCDDPVTLDGTGTTVTVPTSAGDGGGIRGVMVYVCEPAALPEDAALSGQLPGSEPGLVPLLPAVVPGEQWIVLPTDDAPVTEGPVTLSLAGAGRGAEGLQLAGTPEGELAFDVLRAGEDDGVRLAFADDLVIYERLDALPRIHWAGSAEVVRDGEERLDELTAGPPVDTVILDEPHDAGSGAGRSAEVDVSDDAPARIAVDVDAEGDGFLVVADALQDDWTVEVDGEAAELVPADHAAVAVAVPEGEHEVVLRHTPRGSRQGAILTAVTTLALVALAATEWFLRRRRRASDPEAAVDA